VMDMALVVEGNEHVDIQQSPHQMPSSSRRRSTMSLVMMTPRGGRGRNPY
jgi:hypothetical protein